jgi:type I restriction-modification system DNA methylase subunit
MVERQIKTKQRVANYGEVYAAPHEVNAMLDLVKQKTERIESCFLEPACGTGNFLIEILQRKLAVVEARYGKNKKSG